MLKFVTTSLQERERVEVVLFGELFVAPMEQQSFITIQQMKRRSSAGLRRPAWQYLGACFWGERCFDRWHGSERRTCDRNLHPKYGMYSLILTATHPPQTEAAENE